MQPHIHLDESLNISYAIMPGDPARVERIAAYLEQPHDLGINREYRCISGTYRGVKVLAISTGMGGPSTAIAVEELRQIGITHMIRIGSCGALQEGIPIGDLILAQGAVRDDGTSATYVSRSYPAVSDAEMLFLCKEAALKCNITTHTGIVRSHDSFYIDDQDAIDEYWHRMGVLGSDMETATLLTTARLRGVKALSILNNVVLWGNDTFDSIGSYSTGENASALGEKASILLALETFVSIEQKKA
jgi:uridine phosphorylase